ncbi:MAG: SAM-dependent chlorinase/fluorinase [Acidilobaceae archaeon]
MRVIGLITDYGYGMYAGQLKSVIKSIAPSAEVIDIDHSVPPFRVLSGAYVLYSSYRWLPRGSILLSIVDPLVGGPRRIVAVEAGDYVFIGPDNGILYPSVKNEGFKRGVSLDYRRVAELARESFRGKLEEGIWRISKTFHGRDVMGPAAALIYNGVDLADLGEEISEDDLEPLILEKVARLGENSFQLTVIYVDAFGNIVLSSKPQNIGLYSYSSLYITTRAGTFPAEVGRTFSDVSPGHLVVYENSSGFVEIAVNQGSACKKLGVGVGEQVVLSALRTPLYSHEAL